MVNWVLNNSITIKILHIKSNYFHNFPIFLSVNISLNSRSAIDSCIYAVAFIPRALSSLPSLTLLLALFSLTVQHFHQNSFGAALRRIKNEWGLAWCHCVFIIFVNWKSVLSSYGGSPLKNLRKVHWYWRLPMPVIWKGWRSDYKSRRTVEAGSGGCVEGRVEDTNIWW